MDAPGELIERLIVCAIKQERARRDVAAALGGEVAQKVLALTGANQSLYDVCELKADAAAGRLGREEMAALIADDLTLCKARARLRRELNDLLGGEQSGETVKRYGNEDTPCSPP